MLLKNENLPPFMLGTWAWGSGTNGSKMVFGQSYDENILQETFKTACDLNLNLFDTAEVYGMGNSEKLLGRFIAECNTPVQISTKYMPAKKYKQGKMAVSLSKSCERLGIDVPLIYWLHMPKNVEENVVEAIELLKEKKIKYLGVSNYRLSDLKKAQALLQKAGFSISAVQNHFSLLSYSQNQKEILEWCKANHVVYFSYMVLEQGALSGKYSAKKPFPLFSGRRFAFGKKMFRKIEPLLVYTQILAEKYKVNQSQIPIAWAISKGTVPIIGVTKPEHVKQLTATATLILNKDEIQKLEQLAEQTGIMFKASWEP